MIIEGGIDIEFYEDIEKMDFRDFLYCRLCNVIIKEISEHPFENSFGLVMIIDAHVVDNFIEHCDSIARNITNLRINSENFIGWYKSGNEKFDILVPTSFDDVVDHMKSHINDNQWDDLYIYFETVNKDE